MTYQVVRVPFSSPNGSLNARFGGGQKPTHEYTVTLEGDADRRSHDSRHPLLECAARRHGVSLEGQ
jgi:hypothetical protein